MPSKTLKLPINIVAAKGGYCVEMEIGCNQDKVKLLLDTGSSTIAVETNKYKPEDDFYLHPTSYAQCITYGSGGWAGPLVETHLQFQSHSKKMTLKDGHIAIIKSEQQDNFHGADGILGLAYRQLNRAYDLSDYFAERHYESNQTFPWPFIIEENKSSVRTFKKFLKNYDWIKPKAFFTELEEHKICRDKFSIYVKRSLMHVKEDHLKSDELEADPLNQGWLILGSGEEHKELYNGKLQVIDVVHDAYYNTNLLGISIADNDLIKPVDDPYKKSAKYSNSIVDCGSSFLVLQENLYQELMDQLLEISVDFIQQIEASDNAYKTGSSYKPADLDLSKWPDIHFHFQGEHANDVTKLTCKPEHYWQLNALEKDRAWFMIMQEVANIPNKSILGLPLISDYFCVFDREHDKNGVIKVGGIQL
ncbi:pepsin-like aspartic protease [Kangiella sp. HZ709]|uniref:pepsin-like aspartic protease n=1 Tax=Kangiella sp. HZ709 TaxID=2666328 RepID=UPI0012B03D47|nr:pepsin-like aspartic protease [Kangiella sp. HZ709]MRX27900.1 peptidase A1 pepsin [Kangiella sp. HZ709]